MSSNTETSAASSFDWLKWLVVIALVGGGIFGNWYYQDQSLLLRVAGLLVVGVLAAYTATLTVTGGAAWNMLKEARSEIRRVVWPTNQETTQTTIVVLVLVFVFALILWLLDWMLSSLVTAVIG